VTEVVRWFDIKPLEILWNKYLSREHTLLCYGSCIALRYSILHAGRLMHFLEQPPPSWKVRSIYVLVALRPPPPPFSSPQRGYTLTKVSVSLKGMVFKPLRLKRVWPLLSEIRCVLCTGATKGLEFCRFDLNRRVRIFEVIVLKKGLPNLLFWFE